MSFYDRVIRECCRRLTPITQRLGFVLTPLHFYYPVPDTRELARRNVWRRITEMAGVEWNLDAQLEGLQRLAAFGNECDWAQTPDPSTGTYGWQASSFGYSSAMLAYAVVRWARPRKIVEVGCGWSTTVLLQAAARNTLDGAPAVDYLGIDPYPPAYLKQVPGAEHVLAQPVQKVPVEYFSALGEGDILFIDSSHVLAIGSDVQWLYLEILPRLQPGVIVHIHDVQLPYEYPREYAEKLGWFWNEQYLLQALLSGSRDWEILAGGYALCRDRPEDLRGIFPSYDPTRHGETGSFWMRRR